MMQTKVPFYIVDGSGYIFRAYYAIRHLSTSKGIPTNAVYGFTQMLLRLLKEEDPQYLAMVFDSKEPSFRKEAYPAYKANREVPPEDLIPQFDYIKRVVRALNIPCLEVPGFEADDIIATLAKKKIPAEQPVVIVTGDKDLMQLVNHHIQLLDEMKGKRIDIPAVKEKFGVKPEQVVEVLALMGDSSDNVPGVRGIGPKTASQLIQQFGSVEKLYQHLEEIPEKKKQLLNEHREMAFLSRKLVALCEDVSLTLDFESFKRRSVDVEACRDLFKELEFHSLFREFGGEDKRLSPVNYHLVQERREFEEFLNKLQRCEMFSFDTETDSLDPLKANCVGLSFSFEDDEAYYLPIGHDTDEIQLDRKNTMQALAPYLKDPARPKVAQNCKYDSHVLRGCDLEVNGLFCDTMLASYLLDPGGSHKLDNLSMRYLNHKMISFDEVVGRLGDFSKVPLRQAADYSCEDAHITLQLAKLFIPQLKEAGLWNLFTKVELPLSGILMKMERKGIKVDMPFLQSLQTEFAERMVVQEKNIYSLAGEEFNIQSTKQLGSVLFEKLKLPAIKKTKTGYSTDVDVLTELVKLHDLPKIILEFRSLAKLKSTYIDALLMQADSQTHRVHTNFNQTIAETGRLSSSDPNLQNIPIRSVDGAKIRRAFIADEGFTLLSSDYSQIELRVLAHLSDDPALLDAFEKGHDVHRMTAAGIFEVAESLVSTSMRAAAKTVNFAVIYGQTPFGLAQQLGVTQSQAKKYIENYFKKYCGVRDYREKVLAAARKVKEVRTLLGRRRFVPEIDSKNAMTRSFAERIAFNTVIQGTAADLIKKAMVEIDRAMEERASKSHLLLQVHDELVFEVECSEVVWMKEIIRKKMEGVMDCKVPLKVEIGEGMDWGSAHP